MAIEGKFHSRKKGFQLSKWEHVRSSALPRLSCGWKKSEPHCPEPSLAQWLPDDFMEVDLPAEPALLISSPRDGMQHMGWQRNRRKGLSYFIKLAIRPPWSTPFTKKKVFPASSASLASAGVTPAAVWTLARPLTSPTEPKELYPVVVCPAFL